MIASLAAFATARDFDVRRFGAVGNGVNFVGLFVVME